jgi:hypothetical protein
MIKATGIGSVPHKGISAVCEFILKWFPDIPYWPQLFKVSPLETMFLQFAENLPCLESDQERRTLRINKGKEEKEIMTFYDYYEHDCYEYFKITPARAFGFYVLMDRIAEGSHPCLFVKGQVVGPITFLASITGPDGRAILYDQMLIDAIIKGLAMKAVWQAKEIEKSGKVPIIFFDEPYLSGFGSAFVSLERSRVIEILNQVIQILTEKSNARTGIHCCGNTDWAMLLSTNADILSLDAYGFGKYFVLYPKEIKQFLHRGGVVAWGVVPTAEYRASITQEAMRQRVAACFDALATEGIDKDALCRQSMITPACGTGSMGEADASKVLRLTSELSTELLPQESILDDWV